MNPRWPRVAAIGALALLFTMAVLHWSGRHGRLAQDITADDSAYFADGLRRVEALYNGGVGALIASLVQSTPHSPYSTGMAFLGFMFLGAHDWVPYLTNFVLIFGLLIFVDHLARHLDRLPRILLLLATLSVPLAFTAVHDFRPDFAAALFTAIGVVLGLESAADLRAGSVRYRRICFSGIFFAAALLAKPSFFAHTIALTSVPAAFLLLGWRANASHRARGVPLLLAIEGSFFAGALLPALPLFVWDGKHILGYVLTNTGHGADAALWRMPGSTLKVLATNLWSASSAIAGMLGGFLFLFGAIIFAGLTLFFLERARREIAIVIGVLSAVCLSLAILVYGRYSNSFFGLTYQLLLLFGAVIALAPHPRLGRWSRHGLFFVFLTFALWHALAPAGGAYARSLLGPPSATARTNNRDLVELITEHSPHGGSSYPTGKSGTVAFTFWGDVNSATFDWLALKRGFNYLIRDFRRSGNASDIIRECAVADFVVVVQPGTEGLNGALPSTSQQEEILAAFRSSRSHVLLRELKAAGGGYAVWMKENLRTIDTLGASTGLLPIEGPYPRWGLPVVRWGLFPNSTLQIKAATPQSAELQLEGRSSPGQTLTILLNNQRVGEHAFTTSDFESVAAALQLVAGENEVKISYGRPEPFANSDRPTAVLFRKIDLQRR